MGEARTPSLSLRITPFTGNLLCIWHVTDIAFLIFTGLSRGQYNYPRFTDEEMGIYRSCQLSHLSNPGNLIAPPELGVNPRRLSL